MSCGGRATGFLGWIHALQPHGLVVLKWPGDSGASGLLNSKTPFRRRHSIYGGPANGEDFRSTLADLAPGKRNTCSVCLLSNLQLTQRPHKLPRGPSRMRALPG